MSVWAEIEGIDELNKTITEMIKGLNPDKVEPILNKGARIITNTAKKNIRREKTGNLKRGIKTKKLKPYAWNQPAPSIACVDRKIAPHGHLLEFGTSKMPAYPYLRPAVQSKGQQVIDYVTKRIGKLIDDAVRR